MGSRFARLPMFREKLDHEQVPRIVLYGVVEVKGKGTGWTVRARERGAVRQLALRARYRSAIPDMLRKSPSRSRTCFWPLSPIANGRRTLT
jgi:hypothetical protein